MNFAFKNDEFGAENDEFCILACHFLKRSG